MATTKDPMKLYDLLNAIKSNLEDILQDAQSLVNISGDFGGEIARVYKEQMVKYFAPAIKKLIDDENTPGSIIGLIKFTDSVPLALTRTAPTLSDMEQPIVPDNVQLAEPATDGVDTLPQNASYDKGTESTPVIAPSEPTQQNTQVNESLEDAAREVAEEDEKNFDKIVLKEEQEKPKVYRVIKKSTIGSTLGADIAKDVNTSKGKIVGEFDNKEDAEERAALLNKTVTPEEDSVMGIEYTVEEYSEPLEPEIKDSKEDKLKPSK